MGEEKKKDNSKNDVMKMLWPAVSAVLLILLLISLFWGSGSDSGASPVLSTSEISAKVQRVVENDIQGAATVKVANITEESGVYRIALVLSAGGKESVFTSYATRDGKLLFPQALQVKDKIPASNNTPDATTPPQVAPALPKSDVPLVQLFVMSQCPYGVQAENALKPVLDTLKSKIKFELRFIARMNEDGSFSSLHGQPEVVEDERQVCAMNVYPNYMDYIVCRNANIRGTDWQPCATNNGMNAESIKVCSEGKDGESLLSKNIDLGNKIGIGSSPTMLINSQQYQGARTPEDFLVAICSAFNTPPAECSQNLGTKQTAVDEAPHTGCGA